MTTTPASAGPPAGPADPLDMARNCTAAVLAIANAQERDPVRSLVLRLGERGRGTAELAGELALVSIAEDLRRIADHLTGRGGQ